MELKKAHDKLEIRVQERTQELAKVIETLEVNEKLLADESYRLQEANTALKVLLQHREEDQQEMEKTVLANIRKLVLPYVEKLQVTPLTPAQAGYVDIVSANLQNVVSPFLRNITATYLDFTPREIDVANLVCEGKSAKEIALLLNCATRSVEFHKDNIRRKLGITHQKTNLRTHLLSLTKT
jgi:DNA-binding NarL/FixJ family response regulator